MTDSKRSGNSLRSKLREIKPAVVQRKPTEALNRENQIALGNRSVWKAGSTSVFFVETAGGLTGLPFRRAEALGAQRFKHAQSFLWAAAQR